MTEYVNISGITKDGTTVKGVFEIETKDKLTYQRVQTIRLEDGNVCQKINFTDYQFIYMPCRSMEWLLTNMLYKFVDAGMGCGSFTNLNMAIKILSLMICTKPLVPIVLVKNYDESSTDKVNVLPEGIELSISLNFYKDDGKSCIAFGINNRHNINADIADMKEWYIPRLLDQDIIPFYITGYDINIDPDMLDVDPHVLSIYNLISKFLK